MRAASCFFPTFVGPGHPRDRRRASVTGTATIVSRSAAGWRSRPSIGGWRCICGVGRTISRASISRRSSVISFAICADRSTCSGIPAQSIGGARSERSCQRILGSGCTTFLRTRRNSIPPSTCGRKSIMISPTVHRMISSNFALDSPMRRADYVAPRISCGLASMRPTFRGRAEDLPNYSLDVFLTGVLRSCRSSCSSGRRP
jgi:hypothetical protein